MFAPTSSATSPASTSATRSTHLRTSNSKKRRRPSSTILAALACWWSPLEGLGNDASHSGAARFHPALPQRLPVDGAAGGVQGVVELVAGAELQLEAPAVPRQKRRVCVICLEHGVLERRRPRREALARGRRRDGERGGERGGGGARRPRAAHPALRCQAHTLLPHCGAALCALPMHTTLPHGVAATAPRRRRGGEITLRFVRRAPVDSRIRGRARIWVSRRRGMFQYRSPIPPTTFLRRAHHN